MSTKTVTNPWELLRNATGTPAARHRVKHPRQEVTRRLSSNCYPFQRFSGYIKLKWFTLLQVATSSVGQTVHIKTSKSVTQQQGSDSMEGSDGRDIQRRDKMRGTALNRAQVELESSCTNV